MYKIVRLCYVLLFKNLRKFGGNFLVLWCGKAKWHVHFLSKLPQTERVQESSKFTG